MLASEEVQRTNILPRSWMPQSENRTTSIYLPFPPGGDPPDELNS
jgi:hypothetical protein